MKKVLQEERLASSIVCAKAEQADLLTSISLAAKAHWGYSSDFMKACRAELTITPKQIANSDNIILVKEEDSVVVGFAFVKPEKESSGSLEALFIQPNYMNRGFGTELLTAAKLIAKSRGYEKLVIDSDPHAAGFYKKMGAVKTGEVPSTSIEGRLLPQYELLL